MSELTYRPRPGQLLVPGATIRAQTGLRRTVEVRIVSVTHGERTLEAWEPVSGRQVSVRIIEDVSWYTDTSQRLRIGDRITYDGQPGQITAEATDGTRRPMVRLDDGSLIAVSSRKLVRVDCERAS